MPVCAENISHLRECISPLGNFNSNTEIFNERL
jgi:hypothetical protein